MVEQVLCWIKTMATENDAILLPDSTTSVWQEGTGVSLEALDIEEEVRTIPEPHQIAIVFGILVVIVSVFLRKMRYR